MEAVFSRLEQLERKFSAHSFFHHLSRRTDAAHVLRDTAAIGFWIFAFQDVLRLNVERMRDPDLARLVERHRAEESGHDCWFLEDLQALGIDRPDAASLFGAGSFAARSATYRIMAEVLRTGSDEERVVLLLAMEATGHIFFDRMSRYVRAHPSLPALRYFSSFHLDCEEDHEMFETDMQKFLLSRSLSDVQRAACLALCDRVFQALSDMLDNLALRIADSAARPDGADRLISFG